MEIAIIKRETTGSGIEYSSRNLLRYFTGYFDLINMVKYLYFNIIKNIYIILI